jgi:predicted DsbA family dithiol-disulfide isomerase
MSHPTVRIYFDFIDPLSYAASHALRVHRESTDEVTPRLEWVGFELRPPPAQLTEIHDPIWTERWEKAAGQAAALRLSLNPPPIVPWTRKAHELHLFGCQENVGEVLRMSIFDAYFKEGRDIGRVDVLVEIASGVGLDPTATKAVLDVDRHQADVAAARQEAETFGVRDVPSLSIDGRLVEGFPDPTDLGTLLPAP